MQLTGALTCAMFVAGCGRIGFDPLSGGDDSASGDARDSNMLGDGGNALACQGPMDRPKICNERTVVPVSFMTGETVRTLRATPINGGTYIAFDTDQNRVYHLVVDATMTVTQPQLSILSGGPVLYGVGAIDDVAFIAWGASSGHLGRVATDFMSITDVKVGGLHTSDHPIALGGTQPFTALFVDPVLELHPIDATGADVASAGSTSPGTTSSLANGTTGVWVAADNGGGNCQIFQIRTSDRATTMGRLISNCSDPRIATAEPDIVGVAFTNLSGDAQLVLPYAATPKRLLGTPAVPPRIAGICGEPWVFFIEGTLAQVYRDGDATFELINITAPFDVTSTEVFWIENGNLRVAEPCVL